MNERTLRELSAFILANFDVTPEEFLNSSDSFPSIIQLVALRSGKGEKEVRDILNNVVGRGELA